MTNAQLEELWVLEAREPVRQVQLPAQLLAVALRSAGSTVSSALIERARLEAQVLYEGDVIDAWELQRRIEELDAFDTDR
jgi:hypothetical protein